MTDATEVVGGAPRMAEIEVSAKATRRRFTAKQKLEILDEADGCTKMGEIGALMRREGIYSSHLTRWRQARECRELEALTPKKRGPAARVVNVLEGEVQELKRALAKSEMRARRAEALVELQKKISELLGIPQPGTDETP